jgi:hypothetical protein
MSYDLRLLSHAATVQASAGRRDGSVVLEPPAAPAAPLDAMPTASAAGVVEAGVVAPPAATAPTPGVAPPALLAPCVGSGLLSSMRQHEPPDSYWRFFRRRSKSASNVSRQGTSLAALSESAGLVSHGLGHGCAAASEHTNQTPVGCVRVLVPSAVSSSETTPQPQQVSALAAPLGSERPGATCLPHNSQAAARVHEP